MLGEVAFEQVQDNNCYGAYGEFRVVMMKSNGYINATKMCNDGGRRFFDWSQLKSTHQLIQAHEKQMALENTPLDLTNPDFALRDAKTVIPVLASTPCIFIKTANNTPTEQLISGTYCHPDLIPSIAGWISPEFQLKANRVVNGYIVAQYKTAAKEELKAKQLELEWNIELRDAATQEAHEALDYAETVKKESAITQASLILANKENTSLSNTIIVFLMLIIV